MKMAVLACVFAAAACAQNPLARPDPFAGSFAGDQVALDLSGSNAQYSGSLTVHGNRFPVTAKSAGGVATGSFTVNGQNYSFTLTPLPAVSNWPARAPNTPCNERGKLFLPAVAGRYVPFA